MHEYRVNRAMALIGWAAFLGGTIIPDPVCKLVLLTIARATA